MSCGPGGDGFLTAGDLKVSWPEGLACAAEEIPVTDPRMARSWPGSLWRVALRSRPGAEFHMVFVFSRAE